MKILLDTHVLIWASEKNSKLKASIIKEIIDGSNDVYYSTASIWEIAIKKNLGKIDIDLEIMIDALEKMNFIELPINVQHILNLNTLPNYHKDPFDRILIAQALVEPMRLYTHDGILSKYAPELIKLI